VALDPVDVWALVAVVDVVVVGVDVCAETGASTAE
jgi:hypothetical protein